MPSDTPPSEPALWGPEIELYWEDLLVGQLHQLGSHRITAEEIIGFASRFDPQPFHVDPELAQRSAFQGLIASGWHSASIWMRLYWNGILSRAASLGSPGVEKLDWLSPVRPEDLLRGSLEIIDSRPSRSRPGCGLVQIRGELTDHEDVVKLRMTAWGMFGRRSSSLPG